MQHVVYKVVHRLLYAGSSWRYDTRSSEWTYLFEPSFFVLGDPLAGGDVPDCVHGRWL